MRMFKFPDPLSLESLIPLFRKRLGYFRNTINFKGSFLL